MAFVQCPNCGNTVPITTSQCQFCGQALVPGEFQDINEFGEEIVVGHGISPEVVQQLYVAICWVWTLGGAASIAFGLLTPLFVKSASTSIIELLIGLVTIILGIGLLMRSESARKIVNVLAFLNLMFGIFGFIFALVLVGFGGIFKLAGVVLALVKIASSIAMIWLISETDRRAMID